MIFCLSQLHTGTQTTIGWLMHHKDLDGLILSTGVYYGLISGATEYSEDGPIYHEWESGVYEERFAAGMVYHEHVRPDYQERARMSRTQLMMAIQNPTVIPIRDPLASLISYHHRGTTSGSISRNEPEGFSPYSHVIFRWMIMAEFYEVLKRWGTQFICWDLRHGNYLEPVEKNLGLVDRLGMWSGIDNRSGELYPLKVAYLNGDIDKLKSGMPAQGFDALASKEQILRPMLEDLGYQNLLWWDR